MKTRLFFGFVVLAVLTSCVKDPKAVIASYDHEKFIRDKAQYEPIVEKDYWVRMPVSLCTTAAKNPEGDCIILAATTKLQPDGIEEGTSGTPYYHVKLADGRSRGDVLGHT